MKKYENYQDYLNSKEWKELRQETMERIENEYGKFCCELCSKNADHIHHWTYPSNWNYDETEYHIALCKDCHEMVHNYKHSNTGEGLWKSGKDFLRFMALVSDKNYKDNRRSLQIQVIESIKKKRDAEIDLIRKNKIIDTLLKQIDEHKEDHKLMEAIS